MIHRRVALESASMTGPKTKAARFDLEERTAKFGANSVRFARTIPDTPIARPLVSQLVRAATSVGANQCEADDAETRKDFLHKLGICKKEAHETKHWLRMVVVAAPELRADGRTLWREARELNLIFNAIIRNTRAKAADDVE